MPLDPKWPRGFQIVLIIEIWAKIDEVMVFSKSTVEKLLLHFDHSLEHPTFIASVFWLFGEMIIDVCSWWREPLLLRPHDTHFYALLIGHFNLQIFMEVVE
jgi:hypothetical protein